MGKVSSPGEASPSKFDILNLFFSGTVMQGSLDVNGTLNVYNEVGLYVSGGADFLQHSVQFTAAGSHRRLRMAGGMLKILSGGVMQARNSSDSAYEEVHAADFIPASSREFKEDIQVAESENALQQVLNTPIYRYRLKEKKAQKIGFIAEEAPEILRAGEGISLGNSIGLLWKAVQELTKKVEKLESKEV